MGFFDKLKAGLAKTKNALFGRLDQLFRGFSKVDEDMLEELEEVLITADVGVGPTEKIIDGLRGKGGGYKLTKSPDQYPVSAILRLTEDSLAPVACLEENADACPRMADCRTLSLWQGLDKVIHDYLDRITIGDLMQTGPEGYDYVI